MINKLHYLKQCSFKFQLIFWLTIKSMKAKIIWKKNFTFGLILKRFAKITYYCE